MGKSELFSHFADRFEVKRTQAREFFDELNTLAEKELKRSGEFVLPDGEACCSEAQGADGPEPGNGRGHQDSRQDCREGSHRQATQGRRTAAQVEAGFGPWRRPLWGAASGPIVLRRAPSYSGEPAAMHSPQPEDRRGNRGHTEG